MNIHQSYRESAVQGASPVELVVRLYEQMIEDLRQASIALEHKDIERRTNQITHAILVASHLESGLDFANGGKVARDLKHFYDVLRQSLMQVQFYPSTRAIAQQITDLLEVREAWIEVERAERRSGATAGQAVPPAATADSRGSYAMADLDPVGTHWTG